MPARATRASRSSASASRISWSRMRVALASTAASPASLAAPRRAVQSLFNTPDMCDLLRLLHELAIRTRGIHRVASERVDLKFDVGQGRGRAQRAIDHVELRSIRMGIYRDIGQIKELLRAQDPIVEPGCVPHSGDRKQGRLGDRYLPGDRDVDVHVAVVMGHGLNDGLQALDERERIAVG